jgi:hypothetical protein
MKSKLLTAFMVVAASCGLASAATINVAGIANSTVGLITAGASNTVLSGTAYFYVTTTELAASSFSAFAPETTAGAKTSFEALLASPTPLRSATFTNGVLASTGNLTLNPGEKTYLFLSSSEYFGIYQGNNVPSSGAVTMNPATILEDLVGTSTLQNVSGTNSGFQLVAVVPEPSVALLGALGIFGLVRRRR